MVRWEEQILLWNSAGHKCQCGCEGSLEIRSRRELYRNRQYLPGHNRRRIKVQPLSALERSIVLGTLLGDCSIGRPHSRANSRLAFTHSSKQKEYALHKMSVLEGLSWFWQEVPCAGYGDRSIQGSSSCSPYLTELQNIVRVGGGKRVSLEWLYALDDRSLAYWFMDDGSTSWYKDRVSYVAFHTEGYSIECNNLIAEWLTSRGYQDVRVAKSRGYHYIYLPNDSGHKLLTLIEPYMHHSMLYKCRPTHG